jgi:hypothetical protein
MLMWWLCYGLDSLRIVIRLPAIVRIFLFTTASRQPLGPTRIVTGDREHFPDDWSGRSGNMFITSTKCRSEECVHRYLQSSCLHDIVLNQAQQQIRMWEWWILLLRDILGGDECCKKTAVRDIYVLPLVLKELLITGIGWKWGPFR